MPGDGSMVCRIIVDFFMTLYSFSGKLDIYGVSYIALELSILLNVQVYILMNKEKETHRHNLLSLKENNT